MSNSDVLKELPAQEGRIDLGAHFRLHHGDVLQDAHLAYRLVGPVGAPVVAVMGGISSHRFVSACTPRGWWKEIVAPDAGVDTRRFAVLGIDFLGGSGDSTAPLPGCSFHPVSPIDQALALCKVLDHLQLPALHAIVGASYGGMVALAFAQAHASRVRHIVVFSAADRPNRWPLPGAAFSAMWFVKQLREAMDPAVCESRVRWQ